MGIFRRGSRPEHDAGVVYVYERRGDLPAYYSAVCRCGWVAEPVDSPTYPQPHIESRMAAAALAHDPAADTTVAFPLEKPRG